ncbi:hypothetical protein D3C75_649760 [compost metagenome]
MLGQCANRDKIDASFGKFTDSFFGDVTGNFQLRFTLSDCNSLAHILNGEVIEHDNVRSGVQRLFQLLQRFNLDFHRNIRMEPESLFYCLTDRAGRDDVVFFNQECIR